MKSIEIGLDATGYRDEKASEENTRLTNASESVCISSSSVSAFFTRNERILS